MSTTSKRRGARSLGEAWSSRVRRWTRASATWPSSRIPKATLSSSTTATRRARPRASVTPRRLRYERPWQEHLTLYRDLFADPAVVRMLWPAGSAGQPHEDRGQAVLAEGIRHWQERSFGPWGVFAPATGRVVARAGRRTTTAAGRQCVGVAYAR